ncbi:MAG: ABC transporter ATP-binding protein [Anaerolineaceae bacterium]|nr:ABC transporter ATP-binding protein [Anaerolineaceae bacterium]
MNSILTLQDVTKKYGDLTAVDHLSLEIFQGEIFGFLGPNGAGKTTTIQLICGLLKPNSGKIQFHINGHSENIKDHYHQIGLCPQEIILWERLTCIEQLLFLGQLYKIPAKQVKDRAMTLLEELDLLEKKNQLAKNLSGGMKRRLNIAMALINDPQIVILDEPEAGLDPQSRVKIRNYIRSLAEKKTVLLSTHNMDEADRLADRIAIVDHGKLLVLDTPQALKHQLGEGDVLDIVLQSKNTDPLIDQFDFINTFSSKYQYLAATFTLSLNILNGTAQLPKILESLEQHGYLSSEIRIRENTLEDVFIQLTGRRLRE